ncbi:MAG: sigma-54-dependent transcriptional regulator [Spirosomataceae bacterium]
MQRILIIDDEIDICLLLKRFLNRNGYDVAIAHTGKDGIKALNDFVPDAVMCDFKLGDMSGEEILVTIKSRFPSVPVIIITGYSDIKIAVAVMKAGAFDYVTKPLVPEEILLTIKKALSQENTAGSKQEELSEEQISDETKASKPKYKPSQQSYILGEGPESKNLYRQVDLVAPTNYSVIIYGESGSGKEAVALEIHKRSKRANAPFVAMDCGAISKELAASELYGHEKGSFTGALNQKIGHFEMANGGTLFLDEVANLPYDVQISLLRVVQERRFRRLGGNKEIEVDVRIIVASNERLLDAARKGKFREDLFHRFNEFSLDLPPLRERKMDIPNFAQFFLDKTNAELGKEIKGFSPEVMEIFLNYAWYGNLREMRNVVKRATLLSDGPLIETKALPFEIINHAKILAFDEPTVEIPVSIPKIEPVEAPQTSEPGKPNLKKVSNEAEYELILEVLQQTRFNKSKAAEILGIDRKTLYNKMKNFEL